MRLIVDAQACQTESRRRGIGRYMDGLVRAILALRGTGADTLIAFDGTYPNEADGVYAGMRDLLPAANFTRYFYPRPVLPEGDPTDPRRHIASQLIARHYASLCPDAVLFGSMFEGYVEPSVTCENLSDIPGSVAACVLYDLIPLIYPEHYLAQASQRTWYSRKLQALKNCDLLLAISQATRRDAIERLDFPADRIVTIYAAADPIFRRLETGFRQHEETLRRLGITRKYIIYTGNGDFRKNVRGALEAFAHLPSALRGSYQLVLNQADKEQVLERSLVQFGLTPEEVVITGYVDDADLVTLFNCCELFLFPSLYEGFGLPVLEAMACGAPVIGGNNSSIVELIGNADARFDAADPLAIAECMQRALTNGNFREQLREQGERRARAFSWECSASLALEAIKEAAQHKLAVFNVPVRPRRRLAMFTPLPPERTGIANYSAELLPHLARHFVIDVYTTAEVTDGVGLAEGFCVRPWQAFEAWATEYEVIVYQIGNSPFHTHMFDLLARYPGVVILHDFFLSSAFWYMDRHGGRRGLFAEELAYGHGAQALRDLAEPDGDALCRSRYPCNRRVIERSTGVIAHSPGVHALLTEHGIDRIGKPVRVVRQMRALSPCTSRAECIRVRERLGLHPDDWIVCSFGFIADTKLAHLLVRAISESRLSVDQHVHLVFVGELDGGAYGLMLQDLIASSGISDRIHITGFVDDPTYENYLKAADAAVQLRAQSRGETSRAVLDCLAHGIPLIVNAHGTMNDYPKSVVILLDADADPKALGNALVGLRGDAEAAGEMGARARKYIATEHAPARVAADYAAAIDEMLARKAYLDPGKLASDLAPVLAHRESVAELVDLATESLQRNLIANAAPALFVDLSEVVHVDYGTGIHRVVRNLTRELINLSGSSGYRCVPARLDADGYWIASEYARERLGVIALPENGRVTFAPGDALLLLDSAWSEPERFMPVLRAAEESGAEVVGYVYDLIPILYPDTCVPFMPPAFRLWLEHIVRESHAIICISRATADDLISFIVRNGLRHRSGLRIHYAHLGSDLDGENIAEPSEAVRSAFADSPRPTFLMVGTLEPRKGHLEVLDAFDELWAGECDVALCLIGKPGWKMGSFVERLQSHPEFKKRLHWLEHPCDAELDFAYRHAAALIQASHAEGFGLPLLEAARCGTPIVCSDIPVFREIVGDNATFFEPRAAEALARVLRRFVESGEPSLRTPGCVRTWRDAAKDVVRVLGANPAYHIFA